MPPITIMSAVHQTSNLIVPFRNHLDIPTTVSTVVIDKEEHLPSAALKVTHLADSPFSLLLKKANNVRLEAKSSLDIPILFTPESEVLREAQLIVAMRRADGQPWSYNDRSDEGMEYVLEGERGQVVELRWIYPIKGVPDVIISPEGSSGTPIITGTARERAEERIEIVLSGAVSAGDNSQQRPEIRTRAITPGALLQSDKSVVGANGYVVPEFTFDLEYPNYNSKERLQNCLALSIVREHRDSVTGLVTLVFNVIFSPATPFSANAILNVRSATGGQWHFPLRCVSLEPKVEDVIAIEAKGLDKESTTSLRIKSKFKTASPYLAFFTPDSDKEFSVWPPSGELLPESSNGTQLTISFTPTHYGRSYRARLIVQAADEQFVYHLNGVLPEYKPPTAKSSAQPLRHATSANPSNQRKTKNHVLGNKRKYSFKPMLDALNGVDDTFP